MNSNLKFSIMARQRGPLKVQGTLGDINFYKSQDGYLVREKGGVEGTRIKNDPVFQRTRENGYEFGRAAKAGKLVRTAFRSLLLDSDNRVVSRLLQRMMAVLHADAISARGLRNVVDGDVGLLMDFEFNLRSPLSATFTAFYEGIINRTSGVLTLTIPAFVPADFIIAPNGTSHYQLRSSGAAIDFNHQTFQTTTEETVMLPWNGALTDVIAHNHALAPASTDSLFLVLQIAFYQEVNGMYYLLHNGSFSGTAILKADNV
jgi:hypothetical protein